MSVSRWAERTIWAIGCLAAAAVAATATYLSVNSHSSDALLVPPGSERLRHCPVPADPIAISTLGQAKQLQGCNPEGLPLLLPNGDVAEVPSVGAVRFNRNAPDGSEFRLTNWGVPGVGIVWSTSSETQVWGTSPDAVTRELRAWAYDLEHPRS